MGLGMSSDIGQSTRAEDKSFAIQTYQLTKIFNGLVAVNSIDLNIRKGELFALLGPNGAGKTTTINMLCCLLKPTSGTSLFQYKMSLKEVSISNRR